MRYLQTLASSILILLITAQCQKKNVTPPNIIFFFVDDMGWTDTGVYGSSFYETPNIDKLASEGVRFTDAYSVCHVCSPTRASLMTGKYPARINMTDWLPGRNNFPFQKFKNVEVSQQLPQDELTLPEALKENGYTTKIIGKWHLGEEPSGPTAHGFDSHTPLGWNKGWPLTYFAPYRIPGIEGKEGQYLTDQLTDEALEFITQNNKNPFFLYFAHYAVHDPIEGRKDLVEKYRRKLATLPPDQNPAFILEGNPDGTDALTLEERTSLLRDTAYARFSALPRNTIKIKQRQDNVEFAALVESTDESLGRIMNKLKELGLDKNTIIIFGSDNGGMSAANFGRPNRKVDPTMLDKAFATSNLPLRGAKGWMYEGGIRVPMIVKWTGVKSTGAVSDALVTTTDFYPSILEMAGLPLRPQQHLDGVSFVDPLKGRDLKRDAIFWHFPHYSNHGFQSPGGAVRYKNYKLIEYYENNTVQLFDLEKDIREEHDLAVQQPELVIKLRDMLHQWRNDVNAKMMETNPDYVPGTIYWKVKPGQSKGSI